MNEKNHPKVQWQPIVELIVVLLTILGSTIPLYMHTDNKLENALLGIRDEMKDFHTRLALQDQEFKMRLTVIEERTRK